MTEKIVFEVGNPTPKIRGKNIMKILNFWAHCMFLTGKTFFWGAGNVGKCGEIWGNTSRDLPIFSANIEGLTEGQSKSAAG